MTVSSTLEAQAARPRAEHRARPRDGQGARHQGVRGRPRRRRASTTSRTGATAPAGASCAACSARPGMPPRAATAAHGAAIYGAAQVTLPALEIAPPSIFWGARGDRDRRLPPRRLRGRDRDRLRADRRARLRHGGPATPARGLPLAHLGRGGDGYRPADARRPIRDRGPARARVAGGRRRPLALGAPAPRRRAVRRYADADRDLTDRPPLRGPLSTRRLPSRSACWGSSAGAMSPAT